MVEEEGSIRGGFVILLVIFGYFCYAVLKIVRRLHLAVG